MNKTGFQIKNNYFRAALYIKLIVDNVKYRGIQCDFGRLTNVFFVTPDLLLIAVQRDTDFFQYTYYGRVFNPSQKGVLKKAGFAMHDPIAIGCMNAIMRECENPEHKTGHRSLVTGHLSLKPETCNLKPETGNRSLVTCHLSFVTCNLKPVTPARLRQLGVCNQPPIAIGAETKENSTVPPTPLYPPEVNSGQALKGSTQISGEMSGTVHGISPLELVPIFREVRGSMGFEMITSKISTVIHYKKPSATETRFPAEGCISESRAIRACLMIRVFNN